MPLSNETRDFAKNLADERFRASFDFWDSVYYRRLKDFEDYYHVRLPEVLANEMADDERSDLVPSDIHHLTNQFRAELTLPFMRTRRIAKLLGRGPSDVRKEYTAQALFDWSLDVTEYWTEFDLDMLSIATKGFAVGMIELRPLMVNSVQKDGTIREEMLFGNKPIPHYKHLNALKFYPDPTARRLRWPECRYVCYQSYMTHEAIWAEKNRNPEEWVVDAEDLKKVASRLTEDEKHRLNFAGSERFRYERRTVNEPIPVTWYVGDFTHPERPTDFQQAIIGVSDSTLLFFSQRKMPMPYVDFFQIMGINPEDDRLLSMGKIEAVEDTFLELYTKRNQAIDITNVGAYGLTFVQRGHGVPDAHRVGPYTFIEIDNPLNVQTFKGDTGRELLGEVGLTRNEIRDAYGSNYSLGLNPDQRESATGANILVEQQSKQQVMAVTHIWNSGLYRQSILRNMLLQIYTPDEVHIRISEDPLRPMMKVSREQILGKFDFHLAVGVDDFMPDAVRQARMERMLGIYRGDPDIDQLELKRRHLQIMGLNDAELLIVSQDEKEGWAKSENAIILKTGMQMPLWGGEDHEVHYRIHLEALTAAIQMANEGQMQFQPEVLEALQNHWELHLAELQVMAGIQPGSPQVTRGIGNAGQPRATLGPSNDMVDRLQETQSRSQIIANERGVFQ